MAELSEAEVKAIYEKATKEILPKLRDALHGQNGYVGMVALLEAVRVIVDSQTSSEKKWGVIKMLKRGAVQMHYDLAAVESNPEDTLQFLEQSQGAVKH